MKNYIKFIVCISCYFAFLSYTAHYIFIERKLKNKALKKIEGFRSNIFYNERLSRLGNLPYKKNPTSHLIVQPDENKIKIGFFGDSHTDGSENLIGNDFPSLLQKIIGEEYQVINFGRSGYNSNQIYIMAEYFSKIFNLDILFLGPRGFHTERATTFNNYWNMGNIPYSRFILKENKLEEVAVEGKNLEERVENYYSFIPSVNLLKNDHVAPSFLKVLDIVFSTSYVNPFLENEADIAEIQVRLIEALSFRFKKKIIHYTDDPEDCLKFVKLNDENYSLHCVDTFIQNFPYRAEISHPSVFGHYEHAKKIKNIILKRSQSNIPRFRFASSDIVQKEVVNFFNDNKSINDIRLFVNDQAIAKVGANKGFHFRTGLINDFTHGEFQKAGERYVYLGLYSNDKTKLDSLFIELNLSQRKIIRKILKLSGSLERLRGAPNIIFFPIDGKIIHHRNKVYLKKTPDNFLKLLLKRKKGGHYVPKYPTYKFVVNKDVDVHMFWSKNKVNKLNEVEVTSN